MWINQSCRVGLETGTIQGVPQDGVAIEVLRLIGTLEESWETDSRPISRLGPIFYERGPHVVPMAITYDWARIRFEPQIARKVITSRGVGCCCCCNTTIVWYRGIYDSGTRTKGCRPQGMANS